jgi:ligand-binding sensor domain-containing protein
MGNSVRIPRTKARAVRLTVLSIALTLFVFLMFSVALAAGTWTTYTTADGLAANNVYPIVVDSAGVKWFGTTSGVTKFNGTNWTTYTSSNSGLPFNLAMSMGIDRDGNMWFGTDSNTGVTKFDGANSWTNYRTADGLAGNYVTDITKDGGNVWFACWSNGGGGVSKFTGTTWTTYNTGNSGIVSNSTRCVTIDSSGNKWIGTANGLSSFDGDNSWTTYNTTNSGLANNHVYCSVFAADNVKWFGTYGGGVSKLDGNIWTTYNSTNSGLGNNYIVDITIDLAGNVWCATESGGVSKFDGTTWTTYLTADGLANNNTRSIAIDGAGNKWIGTVGGGASKLSNLPPEFVNLPGASSPINLTDGQTVNANPYIIKVKPSDDVGIGRVEFYVDNTLIGTDINPDADGVYEWPWDTGTYHSIVRVDAYDLYGQQASISRTATVVLPYTGK